MSVDFLDSNVVLYSIDGSSKPKQEIARAILNDALATGSGLLSYQVVHETLNTVQRKFAVVVREEDLHAMLIHVLTPLMKVMPSEALFNQGLRISQRYKYSFYDSLIIASALSAGCTRLLSDDMQTGQLIEGLLIVNPFAA